MSRKYPVKTDVDRSLIARSSVVRAEYVVAAVGLLAILGLVVLVIWGH